MKGKLIAVLSIIFVLLVLFTKSINVDALENSSTEIIDEISIIEEELNCNETNVTNELNNQIYYYQTLLENSTDEEQIKQIKSLISTTEELIDEYNSYSNSALTRGSFNLIYSPAVASVLAYFNACGYTLAAELLTHARDNEDLDSIYVPVNKDAVLSSNIYEEIKNGTTYEGTSSFPNSGSTNDKDLYYAIHSFYFSKSISNRAIVIQDRYDYAASNDYGSIGGVAVDLMYSAQENGVLIPYYSVITHNFSGTSVNQSEIVSISLNQKYFEDKVTLGKGEYKDYYITFSKGSTKVFQTLGTKDSYLYIYDSLGNLLASNDDSGYSLNSLIKYYCSANVQYIIRVKFFSTSYYGETKIIVTPSYGALSSDSSTLSSYESIYNTSSSNFTFSTFSSKGYVRLLTYTPSERANYSIETEGDIDTYIYVIDPRSTYLITSSDYNDDGGESFNAKISKDLSANIPYLIIYSRWYLLGDNSSFISKIYKN